MVEFDVEPLAPHKYYTDRPSSRTPEEREQFYQRYLELSAPYFQAIVDAGDKPWWSSEQERRELYFRRYQRPDPPPRLTLDLDVIRGSKQAPAASVCPAERRSGHRQQRTPESHIEGLTEAPTKGAA